MCKQTSSNEILYGKVGFLYSLLWTSSFIQPTSTLSKMMEEVFDMIYEEGKIFQFEDWPLMYEWHHSKYLGAAHGLAGILFILMHFPEKLKVKEVRDRIRGTIDLIMRLGKKFDLYPSKVDPSHYPYLVQWCHGPPAMISMYCKAYEVFSDKEYLKEAERASEDIWKFGLLKKGPGLCHGIGGNGYSFLSIYRLTQDQKYLYQAHSFAKFSFKLEEMEGMRTPDNPNSLFQGRAGLLAFYYDLLNPMKSSFPAYELENFEIPPKDLRI